ncbi:MAG: C40 family peptidase [Tannerellaceae bacterium]|jgi:lipoprotein Spr|nr:C40 family peptidase [Tannerellaceae bacterium]
MRDKIFSGILLSFMVFLMFSCGITKPLPAGVESPKKLSDIFGFKVTYKDNLLLYTEAANWLNVKHKYGGNTKSEIDCSGLVVQIYDKVYKKRLKRSSADMLKNNCRKIRRKNLQEGDLVFFRTTPGSKKVPNHVGIYLKDKYFIHASSSRGVKIDKVNSKYFDKYWITGGRVK